VVRRCEAHDRSTPGRAPVLIVSEVENIVAGIVVFSSVAEALRAGFEVYDRTDGGYLVRRFTERGWALGIVHIA
jgi:hypothetical protein